MTRDELVKDLAAVLAGMQVPVSMSMPLGTADEPLRRIMSLRFGWLDAEDYETMFREILYGKQCEAVIYHGPGHQSKTKCEQRFPHDIHQASLYGEHVGLYEWESDIASADWNGEAREVVQCPNCKVLRDPDDTSPCRGYKCTQERK